MKTLQYMEGYAGSELEQCLIQEIESGKLAQNASILSTPKLAKRFDISVCPAQKVLQKLTRKGYLVRQCGKRTLVADRWKRHVTRTIGVITPNLSVDLTPFSSPFHYEILSGIWLGADNHEYDVKIFSTRQAPVDLQHPESLGVSGVIILLPNAYDKLFFEALSLVKMPCVVINLLDPGLTPCFHCINPDYKLLGEMAAEQILKLKKKKVAFYAGCKLMPNEPRQHVFDVCSAILKAENITLNLVELPNKYDSVPEFQIPYRDHVIKQMEGIEVVLPYRLFEQELLESWGIEAEILGGVSISRNDCIKAPTFFIDLKLIGRTAADRLATLFDAPETPVLELKIPPALLQT